MNIGERIQALRKARGMSQEELANQIGVSRQAVSKWEAGQSQPDLDKVLALSDFFGVTTDYLLRNQATPTSVTQEPAPSAKKGLGPMSFFGIGTAINLIAVILYAILETNYHTVLCMIPSLIGCTVGTTVSLVGIHATRDSVTATEHRRSIIAFWGANTWLILFPIPFSLCWYIPSWSHQLEFSPAALILYLLLAIGLSAYFIFFHNPRE